MYCSPSAPLILISNGVVTERITIAALAPGYSDVTVTVGGEICGYCAIGSVGIVTNPASSTTKLSTPAKCGRRRKNSITTALRPRRLPLQNERSDAASPNSWHAALYDFAGFSVTRQPYAFHVGRNALGAKPCRRSRYA